MRAKRYLIDIIKKSKKSFLLLGPRQTGKSTLVASLKPDLSINLAEEPVYLNFLRDPSLLKKTMGENRTIFIDEVQRIPSLLNTVQSILDTEKTRQFYLTGSSARKLKRGQANLLPGRIFTFELGPLNNTELGSNFSLERALAVGLLPGVYFTEDSAIAKKMLRSYAGTYLREEIQAEALTRNLEGFSRFFDVVTSRSGDFTDFSKVASQAMIERMSAKRYFDILVDTLVVNTLEPFAKSAKRRLIQHPKYYFFDVGVLNGCLSNFEISGDRKGNLFEHLCQQLIRSEAKSRDVDIRLSLYRTDAGAEVDFILEKEGNVFAIEVKATHRVGGHDLRGLKSFAEYYGKKHIPLLIYLGDSEQRIDGISILPVEKAIERIFS